MLTDRDLKEELHALAEGGVGDNYVSALLTFGGNFGKDEKGEYLSYSTHDYRLALELASYLLKEYAYHAEVRIVDPDDKRRNRKYTLEVRGKVAKSLLADVGKVIIVDGKIARFDLGVKRRFTSVKKEQEYVRGVYLSVGSVTRAAEGLRLEMTFELESDADALHDLLARDGILLGKTEKGEKFTLSTRKGQTIADFAARMGASKSCFVLHDMVMKRDMNSNTARAGNLLLANTEKSVSAAVTQYEDAVTLRDGTAGFCGVPDEIREVAEARIKNPDVSLAELLYKLPHVITKSGLYHRLKKMHDLAQKIREEHK